MKSHTKGKRCTPLYTPLQGGKATGKKFFLMILLLYINNQFFMEYLKMSNYQPLTINY